MTYRRTWPVIVALVLWWFGMEIAMKYGGIWDSLANPTERATVVLSDGQQLTGALSRTWSEEWVLRTADEIDFTFRHFKYMKFAAPAEPRGFASAWRSWLPVLLVNGLLIAVVLGNFRRQR